MSSSPYSDPSFLPSEPPGSNPSEHHSISAYRTGQKNWQHHLLVNHTKGFQLTPNNPPPPLAYFSQEVPRHPPNLLPFCIRLQKTIRTVPHATPNCSNLVVSPPKNPFTTCYFSPSSNIIAYSHLYIIQPSASVLTLPTATASSKSSI